MLTEAQIEKDAQTGLPDDYPPHETLDSAYQKGAIEILEANYSGDNATIILTMGSLGIGNLVPPDTDTKAESRPRVVSIDAVPYKLQIDYEWLQGEWRLRRLENLTIKEEQPATMDTRQNDEPE